MAGATASHVGLQVHRVLPRRGDRLAAKAQQRGRGDQRLVPRPACLDASREHFYRLGGHKEPTAGGNEALRKDRQGLQGNHDRDIIRSIQFHDQQHDSCINLRVFLLYQGSTEGDVEQLEYSEIDEPTENSGATGGARETIEYLRESTGRLSGDKETGLSAILFHLVHGSPGHTEQR